MQSVALLCRQNINAWKYLLLGLFLLAQSLAASHQTSHISHDVQEDTCILCQSTNNHSLDTPRSQSIEIVKILETEIPSRIEIPLLKSKNSTLTLRGPPSI